MDPLDLPGRIHITLKVLVGVAPEPPNVSHITAVVMETGGGMNVVLADIPECVW